MTDAEVTAAITLYEVELGIPATDALTRSTDRLVDMVVARVPAARREADRRPLDDRAAAGDPTSTKIEHNARTLVDRLARQGHRRHRRSPRPRSARPRSRAALARRRRRRRSASHGSRTSRRCGGPASRRRSRLIRSPMLSQVDRVGRARRPEPQHRARRDRARCPSAARRQGRVHGVVLMVELGDLREGILPDDVEASSRHVLGLPNLVASRHRHQPGLPERRRPRRPRTWPSSRTWPTSIETTLRDPARHRVGRELGQPRLGPRARRPPGRINDLRLGESILLGCEPLDRRPIDGLHTDAFTSSPRSSSRRPNRRCPGATSPRRPSAPRAEPVGRGTTFQTILAAGHQDTDPAGLRPSTGIEILGASSDHLVVDSGRRIADRFRAALSAQLQRTSQVDDLAVRREGPDLDRPLTGPDGRRSTAGSVRRGVTDDIALFTTTESVDGSANIRWSTRPHLRPDRSMPTSGQDECVSDRRDGPRS